MSIFFDARGNGAGSKILVLMGVLVLILVLVILLNPTGFLSRGAIGAGGLAPKALVNEIPMPTPGAHANAIPTYFTDPRNEGHRTAVRALQVDATAAQDLLARKIVSLSVGEKTYARLKPLFVHTQVNGNRVVAGTPLKGSGNEDNGGSFLAVFNPEGKLLYLTANDPFDQTTNGSTTLLWNGSIDTYLAQNMENGTFGPENDQHVAPPIEDDGSDAPPGSLVTGTGPVTIRTLALMTPNTIAFLGGVEPAIAYIQGEVEKANLIFQLSGVQNENGFYRHELAGIVNTGDFGYNETGNHLLYITSNTQVAALREQYHADLVSMFSSTASYCGIAWILKPWLADSSAYGFSDVVVMPACQSKAVYAHETGHNIGMGHDHANAGGSQAFPFSFGYRTPDDDPEYSPAFRTVMAYTCTTTDCPRIDRYSNPEPAYNYNGHHTGVPHDHSESSDNAYTGIVTIPYVANFHDSVPISLPGAPQGLQATDGVFSGKVRLAWTLNPLAIQYDVYRSTSPDMSNPELVAITSLEFADDDAYDSTPLTFGQTYYYAVKSENPSGQSTYSNVDAGSLSGGFSDAAVNSVRASDGLSNTEIVLSWKNSSLSTVNRLYRATQERYCVPADLIKEFTGLAPRTTVYTTETPTDGIAPVTIYYYSVGAVQADGTEICHEPIEPGFSGTIGPPTGITASDGTYTDHVHVEWNPTPSTDYYQLYRSTQPDMLGTGTSLVQDHLTSPSYDDTALTSGFHYYYAVKAHNTLTGFTGFSASDIGYTQTGDGIVTNIQASDGTYADRVELTWDPEPGASQYVIYRGTTNSLSDDSTQLMDSAIESHYTDTLAGVRTTYYYWVKPQMGGNSGVESGPDSGFTNTANSPCLNGDFDLGGGNCQAKLRGFTDPTQPAYFGIEKTGSSWSNVVNATQGDSFTSAYSTLTTQYNQGTFKTSRLFWRHALQPYANKTITSAGIRIFTPGFNHQIFSGDEIQIIPSSPASATMLTLDDFDAIQSQNPTIYASANLSDVENYGYHDIPFTGTGLNALRTAASTGTGMFNTAWVFSQNYQPFTPTQNVLNSLQILFRVSPVFDARLVVNYHA